MTNGMLAGIGSVNGPVVVGPAGNLGAGDTNGVGTFTINNGGNGGDLTLQGNATLRVNKTGGTLQQPDQIAVSGNVTYGGILTITNITTDGSPLAVGDTVTLFTAGGFNPGGFAAIQNAPFIPGLAWSNDVANLGNFIVIASTAVAPVAGFSGSPTNLFVTQSVVFTNSSTGNITSSAWTFGDGNVANLSGASAGNNVTNIYNTAGTPYTVRLIVSGAGGSSTNTQTAYITVKPKAVIGQPVLSGGSLILSGANGPAGQPYRILSSTNVALNVTNWVPVYTNVFAPDGSYSYTNTPLTNVQSFFRLVSP